MSTVKVFYKREAPTKRFFARNVKIKSYAHGKEVSKEFAEWREYFLKSAAVYKDKFRPFLQKSFYGDPYSSEREQSAFSVRYVNGERYELSMDGTVTVGGKRTALQVGSETKAWTLISFPRRTGQVTAIAVIGKPKDGAKTRLSVYKSTGGRLDAEAYCSVDLETTLDAESYLVAFGRHLFLVHDFTLDYYYFDYENAELQRVAIGGDEENDKKEACKLVAPRVVANDDGFVFWHSESCAYGFPIGYPSHLISFPCPSTETIVHIECEKNAFVVRRKDKNTSKISRRIYELAQNGYFEERKSAGKA